MTIDSSQLLHRLLGPIRPAGLAAPPAPRLPIEAQSFEQLLAQASQGELRSERSVTIAPGVGAALEAIQLDRLAQAADRAETAGARRALMAIDGRALVIDLPSRTVVHELSPSTTHAVVPVDAAVSVPAEGVSTPPALRRFPGLHAALPIHSHPRMSGSSPQGA
jgi:hypothetical protein